MRRTIRPLVANIAVSCGLVLAASAAAPVTPSYQGVERSISRDQKCRGKRRRTTWLSPIGAGWDMAFC